MPNRGILLLWECDIEGYPIHTNQDTADSYNVIIVCMYHYVFFMSLLCVGRDELKPKHLKSGLSRESCMASQTY